MSDQKLTVQVEPYTDHQAIKMTWNRQVEARDVLAAFHEITRLLGEMQPPVCVVVDLLANPQFPLTATINGALFGPYRDERLQSWLIVGGNPLARLIERTLKSVSGRSNVYWFATEDAALAYMTQQCQQKII